MDPRSHIENVLSTYAWAYDFGELDQAGKCFATDAEVLFSSGPAVGRDAVVAELRRRRAKYPAGVIPWHVVSNVIVREQHLGRASVLSAYTFFLKPQDGPPVPRNIGTYDDSFVLDGDRWLIAHRRVLYGDER